MSRYSDPQSRAAGDRVDRDAEVIDLATARSRSNQREASPDEVARWLERIREQLRGAS